MQLELIPPEPHDERCRFPQLSGATAWRYGCRCRRCRTAHESKGPSPYCEIEGCDNLRLKGTRRCADHPRRRSFQSKVRREPCELCGRTHMWYESQLGTMRENIQDLYRRTCSKCRQRYMGVIQTHRLSTDQAMKLIMATHCELCTAPFSITMEGRRACHVDHDHRCCPSSQSCGQCVRGILCPRCNTAIAHVERLEEVGIQRIFEYIERWETPA